MRTFYLILGLLVSVIGMVLSKFQVGTAAAPKQAMFDRFDGSCPGHNVSIIYEMKGLKSEGSKMIINTTITVKYDILTDPTMLITIHRCRSKENLDTCEHFRDFKTTKYCAMLASSSGLWDSYFKTFTPPWKCPIKKGLYQSVDGVIDLSAFLLLTREDWYWRVNVEVREKRTNKMLFCMYTEAIISTGKNQTEAAR